VNPATKTTARSQVLQEVDTTIKYSQPVEGATVDIGGTLYMYPRSKVRLAQTEYTTEVFTGLKYKAFLTPAVYAYYDLNLKQLTVEGSLSQAINITSKLALVPSVQAGYVAARDVSPEAKIHFRNEYRYAGGSLDLVYTFNKAASLSVGGRNPIGQVLI
jgi:hypothetical protein